MTKQLDWSEKVNMKHILLHPYCPGGSHTAAYGISIIQCFKPSNFTWLTSFFCSCGFCLSWLRMSSSSISKKSLIRSNFSSFRRQRVCGVTVHNIPKLPTTLIMMHVCCHSLGKFHELKIYTYFIWMLAAPTTWRMLSHDCNDIHIV